MTYVSRLLNLIELERVAEIERHTNEIAKLSAQERRALGRCEFFFKGVKAPSIFQYTVVKFVKPERINTKISTGDMVLISRGNPLDSDTTGTVTQTGRETITVAFDQPPPKWAYQNHIRIDLYSNDIPFRRMQDNLRWFYKLKHPLKSLVLDERPSYPPKPVSFTPFNRQLNPSQQEAISKALGTRDMFLIHGPPGTGKTTTLVELIYQASIRGKSVLATAESNTAADNMLVKLAQYPDLNIVRVGHPARIVDGYEDYSLHAHFEAHPLYGRFKRLLAEIKGLRISQHAHQRPTSGKRRGLTDTMIRQMARSGKVKRGLHRNEVRSMHEWLKRDAPIQEKHKNLKDLENEIQRDILTRADIVISTNSMAGSPMMQEPYFDIAVIDEGSQQVEPSTLIPLLKARRCVIAGDDKQLPPTIINPQAKDLQNTLFARFKETFPHNVSLLNIQYRMHEGILAYPQQKFYNSQLRSDKSVQAHTLEDLMPEQLKEKLKSLQPSNPVQFKDTSAQGIQAYEYKKPKSPSYENKLEAQWVEKLIAEGLKQGLKPEHIGVITPYQGQVRLLKRMLETTSVEVDSIDGFQGREKEMIILSLVRANEEERLGFLSDLRRLNVAITRAKRKLIIVGHGDTLKSHPVYEEWLGQIE